MKAEYRLFDDEGKIIKHHTTLVTEQEWRRKDRPYGIPCVQFYSYIFFKSLPNVLLLTTH